MLLPKPGISRESAALTRSEVRSLERATLLSTVSAPSVVSVESSYGISADRRLGWRFMESLGDRVITLEHELKAQAAAAAANGAATMKPPPADEVAKRCYRAVKEGLQILSALKPLHAKRLVHAALAPKHVVIKRDGSLLKLIGLGSTHYVGSINEANLPDGVLVNLPTCRPAASSSRSEIF